jgi:hypothetical protein
MKELVRRSTYGAFRRLLGDVRREVMQRLTVALHSTLGSYLPNALQEGSADVVACLLAFLLNLVGEGGCSIITLLELSTPLHCKKFQ